MIKHIIHRLVIQGEELTEEILLESHKYLTDEIDVDNKEKGKYEIQRN